MYACKCEHTGVESHHIQFKWVVVNIKTFNKITMLNAYSVFFQADILTTIQNAKYIFTVNCNSFFLSIMCQFKASSLPDCCLSLM